MTTYYLICHLDIVSGVVRVIDRTTSKTNAPGILERYIGETGFFFIQKVKAYEP